MKAELFNRTARSRAQGDSAPKSAGSSRAVHRRIFRLGALLLLGVMGSQTLFSQTTPVTYRTPNRWLLIVETTRALQPRAEAVAQLAGNLVLSGMNGQLRPGDSLGLWTFNDKLHAGEFSLQTWTPANAKDLAERVALFVARQTFENRAGRDQMFPAMNNVISNSEFITVILITGGNETVSGTPFDKAINAIHKQWQTQQEQAGQPFLTMLRAQRGRITDFEVGRPPAPLAFPPLPPELQITNAVVPVPAIVKVTNAPVAPTAPNLIIHGKKPEPVAEMTSNLPPAAVFPTNLPAHSEVKTNPPTAPVVSVATDVNPPATNSSGSSTNLATTAAVEQSASRKTFWMAVAIAIVAAAGLVGLLIRRSRSQPRVSLITRSLDREQK